MDFNVFCVSGLAYGLYLGFVAAVVSLVINTFFVVALGDA